MQVSTGERTIKFIVEMDCAEAMRMINGAEDERSTCTFLVKEIKRLLADRVESKVVLVRREQNLVSHTLANMGRLESRTEIWLQTGPRDIPRLCNLDCNPGGKLIYLSFCKKRTIQFMQT
jgi:hypothetical protein